MRYGRRTGAVEVYVLPSTARSLPDARLFRLHRIWNSVSVNQLGEACVGDARGVV